MARFRCRDRIEFIATLSSIPASPPLLPLPHEQHSQVSRPVPSVAPHIPFTHVPVTFIIHPPHPLFPHAPSSVSPLYTIHHPTRSTSPPPRTFHIHLSPARPSSPHALHPNLCHLRQLPPSACASPDIHRPPGVPQPDQPPHPVPVHRSPGYPSSPPLSPVRPHPFRCRTFAVVRARINRLRGVGTWCSSPFLTTNPFRASSSRGFPFS